MVKTKHQKSKPKKHNPQIKKQGKQADISQFRAQLDALGLQIVQVTADGNCFFRALADQLEGNEEEHMKYRSMVVQYILKNREIFEPFIEDDVPFDEYCQSMDKDGTWAGHMELQAASLVTHSNICIHRNMSPRWYIRNFDDHGARMVHLSYHDGEHYNSVRLKEDSCEGPARPIIIKADADLSMTSHQAKAAVSKSEEGTGRDIINAGSIKLVIAGTGCEDAEKVEQVLLQVDGDVDAAIEFLVAEQGTEECSVQTDAHDSTPNYTDTSHGNGRSDENGKFEQQGTEVKTFNQDAASSNENGRFEQQGTEVKTFNQDAASSNENGKFEQQGTEVKTFNQDAASSNSNLTNDKSRSRPDNKNISRNQICSCGSKKKYKACCGSVAARPSTKFVVNQMVESRKGRKERKQGKKGATLKASSTCGSDGGPPDMGALCI